MPKMPGVKAPDNMTQSFRYEVMNLLGRKTTSFPGAQPVSFGSRHLLELQTQDYYVCEKTDGIRCLMYLTREGDKEVVYLIDRKNEYYHVPDLHFPLEGDDLASFHTETILDGELVNDTDPTSKQVSMKYLVFDCLIMDSNNLMHRTLDKRLAYFRQKLLSPYEALYKKFPDELQFLPFTIHFKHQEFGYAMEQMFNRIIPSLHHGSDGLIFTCRNSPYTPGTDEHILKWKPESENSVDFRMHLRFPTVEPDPGGAGGDEMAYFDYTAFPQVELTVNGGDVDGDVDWGSLALSPSEWETMKSRNEPLNDRIVECYMDKSTNWRYLRFRDDKEESNHISTVKSVMESIHDAVTKEDLINHEKKIKSEWKRRQSDMDDGRREAEARKPLRGTNAQNGEAINGVGLKRKIEESEQQTG